MGQYQTIKTQAGLGLEAAAETGGPAIKLIAMSVGDGGGSATQPSSAQTALVHEVDRVNLNNLSQNATDATQWVAEAVLPADRGGYTVREVGLWTDGGVLFAVANFPETYKPSPSEGTAGQMLVSLNFRAQNSDNVTLVVDGNLQLATRDFVRQEIAGEAQRVDEKMLDFVSGTHGADLGGGDLKIVGLYWQGNSGAPIINYQDSTGKWQFVGLITPQALDQKLSGYQTKGNYVSGTLGANLGGGDGQAVGLYHYGNLNTATLVYLDSAGQKQWLTLASQAMADGKLSRTGDTTSGNLLFNSGNAFTNWAASPQTIFQIGSAIMSLWGQVDGAGNMQLVLGGNNPGQGYLPPWVFNPNKRIAFTPAGNTLLETGDTSAARVRQTFRVSVASGAWISWPKAFSSDANVFAHFTATDQGNGNLLIVNYGSGQIPNRFGVFVTVYNTRSANNQTTPATIDVTVEGYA